MHINESSLDQNLIFHSFSPVFRDSINNFELIGYMSTHTPEKLSVYDSEGNILFFSFFPFSLKYNSEIDKDILKDSLESITDQMQSKNKQATQLINLNLSNESQNTVENLCILDENKNNIIVLDSQTILGSSIGKEVNFHQEKRVVKDEFEGMSMLDRPLEKTIPTNRARINFINELKEKELYVLVSHLSRSPMSASNHISKSSSNQKVFYNYNFQNCIASFKLKNLTDNQDQYELIYQSNNTKMIDFSGIYSKTAKGEFQFMGVAVNKEKPLLTNKRGAHYGADLLLYDKLDNGKIDKNILQYSLDQNVKTSNIK